jgi:hypothetical protein
LQGHGRCLKKTVAADSPMTDLEDQVLAVAVALTTSMAAR